MNVEVVIIGSGFSGINMAIKLLEHQVDSFVIFEKSSDVGGVWRDNIYPGCTCDIKAALYSLKSEPNSEWTSNYPKQDEIYSYIQSIAHKYHLKDQIKFNTAVTQLQFDQKKARWHISTTAGSASARIVILATGPQRLAALPDIQGLENLKMPAFHSSQWDFRLDIKSKRVAVIGTGASSVQIVPSVQQQVDSLLVFQRTPSWILPRMQRNIFIWERRLYKVAPFILKLKREVLFWFYELIGTSFNSNKVLHRVISLLSLVRLKLIIKDKVLRAQLTPDYKLGCKRILVSDKFYQALKMEHINLITDPIVKIENNSIYTSSSAYQVDVVIYATGFKVADIEQYITIIGNDGLSLDELWSSKGAEAFLGTNISGFPNLCYLLGPNSGLSHSSALHAMESQVSYVIQYIQFLKTQRQGTSLNIKPEVQETYNKNLQQNLKGTVWDSGCTSWFLNKNNKNTIIFPGSLFAFRKATKKFEENNYEVNML